jgi:ADP-dependent phosphofructokinase/glucokinase
MADKIVLGLAGTVDYEITWDTAVIERLCPKYDIRPAELSTQYRSAGTDLLRSLLAFVRKWHWRRAVHRQQRHRRFIRQSLGKKITLAAPGVRAAIAMDN